MKLGWWVTPIIAALAVVGAISAQAVFASHLPIPEVVANYPETQEDVKGWVFHLKYKGESHFIYPTNPLGMGGPTQYDFMVDDWSDWGHDPLPHWVFWWKDWTGKIHYYSGLGQVERRATGPGGSTEGVRWEAALTAKIQLEDGQVAFDCYARAIPQNFTIWDGVVNPRSEEHTNRHVNKLPCVFQRPASVTPPTPQPTQPIGSPATDRFPVSQLQQYWNSCTWDASPGCLIRALDGAFDSGWGNTAGRQSSVGGWYVPGPSIVWTNTFGSPINGTWVTIRAQGPWGVFYAPNGATVPTPGRSFQLDRPVTCRDLPMPCSW